MFLLYFQFQKNLLMCWNLAKLLSGHSSLTRKTANQVTRYQNVTWDYWDYRIDRDYWDYRDYRPGLRNIKTFLWPHLTTMFSQKHHNFKLCKRQHQVTNDKNSIFHFGRHQIIIENCTVLLNFQLFCTKKITQWMVEIEEIRSEN